MCPGALLAAALSGLFYFDASYRPVPLELSFIGVSETNMAARTALMNDIAYDKVCVRGCNVFSPSTMLGWMRPAVCMMHAEF